MNRIMKERLPQLDLFRAFAIFCVIQVHSSSFAAAEQALNSPYFYFFNWMNIFFKVGTPSFIFLSSFVLFYNYFDQPVNGALVRKFYKKRLTYIILPYILVSCCYYAVVAYERGILRSTPILEHLQTLGLKLLTGTAYTHLYFVFISIQFYILFPLLLWLFQSFRKHKVLLALILPLGLALQWGFVFLNKYQLQLPNKGSYALSYMAYYMMGAAFAIYFEQIKGWLKTDWKKMSNRYKLYTVALWSCWLIIAFVHVQLWYSYRQGLSKPNTFWFELLWNVHTLFSAIVLMKAAFIIHRKASAFWVKFFTRMGEVSFAMYLFHPVVLLYYRKIRNLVYLPGESLRYLAFIVGGSLCAIFISWGFVQLCFKRLPFASVFLGSVPSSLRKKKTPAGTDSNQKQSIPSNM